MITGIVNRDIEPTIRLTVRGQGNEQELEAIVDTGFTGFLTLPPAVIATLGLPRLCRGRAELANGTIDLFDIHEATVVWDGTARTVEAESADTDVLVGMALIKGSHLHMHAVDGGAVVIRNDAELATSATVP
jgi:clan AA aspartic protease